MAIRIMAVWTEEINTNYNFPHINVYNLLKDGVLKGYEARTVEGYVMYDTTANDTEMNPETMEEVPVTFYYTLRGYPASFNFANFTMVAVPRDSVDENYIFGGGTTPTPEVM